MKALEYGISEDSLLYIGIRSMEHTLPQEFFAIQLTFAERVAQVRGLSLDEAVYTYTVCQPQFFAESLERSDPLWREFVEGLERASDRTAYTHGFYLAHRAHYDVPSEGCFYYGFWPEGAKIRLHFVNNDRSGQGALSNERMPTMSSTSWRCGASS